MKRLTIGGLIGLLVLVLAVSLAALASIPDVTPAQAATSCAPNPIGGPLGWAVKAPPPTRVEGETGVIIGSQLFVTHGSTGVGGIGIDSAINQIYNLTTNSWSAGAGASVLRAELVGVCALHLGTAKVFAIGGRYGGVLSTVEMYDPVANSWSLRTAMPTARAGLGAATDPTTNTIYVIGGRTGYNPQTGAPLAANEAYNPVTDTWSAKAPMPTPMMDIYSTVYVNGKIYVIGGFDGTSVSNLVQIYDPGANSWSAGAPMPTARSNLIAGVCGGKIYAIGGFDGTSSNLATNEVYDPVANTWTPGQPSKPTAASEMASAVISTGQDIFAVGSGIRGHASALNEVFTCAAAPTSTPTPGPVGGISLDPQLPGSSGGDAGLLAGAMVAMAGASALGGAAWYVRRRRVR